MRRVTTSFIVCLLVASASPILAAHEVRFVVRVPADTPAVASIYVAGSLPGVGNWSADGLKLTRQPDGSYTGNVDLEVGQTLEFKITRGTWATVEKNADGGEHANRTAVIDADTRQIDVTVDRWASGGAGDRLPSTVVGTLKLHSIDSRALKQSRTIRVWLPPGYDADANARFDVLYMQDGQNCFDRATSAFGNEWEIDESLTKLIAAKRVPPLIVVGIDNGLANRINEFTYNADSKDGGGKAAEYADFLLNEVKPFIDKTYRTQPGQRHTFIGGSSLGGLFTLEIARRHIDAFGGVIAMSPSLWWASESLTHDIERDPGGLAGARVWLDIGSREGGLQYKTDVATDKSQRFVDAARRLDAALLKHRVEHRLTIDDQNPEHNEPAWAHRFPPAISYILDVKN